jgi:cohesin complex subunit SA-1/2
MIDQALNLLNLHIIWKARGLTASSEPAAEEIRYSELLREQRDSLVEKLIEYAVGTQSNTADGVKRSVRKDDLTVARIRELKLVSRRSRFY